MELRSIASGSSGNCVLLQTEKTRILIDAGYSAKRISNLLKSVNVELKTIDAILVTHEHSDHICGVGVLSRRYHLPIFANPKTWDAMKKKLGRIDEDCHRTFQNQKAFVYRDITIFPLPVHHDAADPVGYIFTQGDEKVSVVTDTGFVDDHMMAKLAGSDIYYFESNYEEDLLRYGNYSEWSKMRISGGLGHLSNQQSGIALADLLEGRGEQVLLAHMSINNNTSDRCYQTVTDVLREQGYEPESDVHVHVAPRYEPSPLYSAAEIRTSYVGHSILSGTKS